MWKKMLISSIFVLSFAAPIGVSADVVTDTTGVTIKVPTTVQPTYDMVVSQLTPDDYQVTVTKMAATPDNNEEGQSINNLYIGGPHNYPYVLRVVLTDVGKQKVMDATGISSDKIDSVRLIAKINGVSNDDPAMYGDMKGLPSNVQPEVGQPIAVVSVAGKPETVSSNMQLQNVIASIKKTQETKQADHPISRAGQDVLKQSSVDVSAAVDVPSKIIDHEQRQLRAFTPSKDYKTLEKTYKREKIQRSMVNVAWRLAGVLLLVGSAAGVGYTVWRMRKKIKGLHKWE